MILTDAGQNVWEKRWFVLRRYSILTFQSCDIVTGCCHRPYLHIYARSNELEETGIVSLNGVNVESDPHKESLLGVSPVILSMTVFLFFILEAFFVHSVHLV